MYGTVAKLQVKAGSMDALQSWGSSRDAGMIPGYISQYVFQTDANSNVLFLVVIFADKASYEANARNRQALPLHTGRRSLRMYRARAWSGSPLVEVGIHPLPANPAPRRSAPSAAPSPP